MQQPDPDSEQPRRADDPVDDYTYGLLQALTAKLESAEAYEIYAGDAPGTSIFTELAQEDRRHASRLLEELRLRLTVLP